VNSSSAGSAATGALSPFQTWIAVIILTVLYLFSQIDRLAINMAVTPIKHDLGLADFRMGLILGPAFAICYAIAPFPLAWLADRSNRRMVLFWCILIWATAVCATALTWSFESMFVARMLTGIGEAALMPCAYVMISRLFPPDRLSFALSVFSLGTVGGIALGFGLGGWLVGIAGSGLEWPIVGQLAPWRSLFLIVGLPCFALAFLLYFVPDATDQQAPSHAGGHTEGFTSYLLKHKRAAMAILLGFGISAYNTGAILAWLPSYTLERFGWGPAVSGPILGAMVVIVATIGKLGSGVAVDMAFRRGIIDAHPRYLLAMYFLSGPLLVAAFFVDSAGLFVAFVAAWFLFGFPVGGYGPALIQLMAPVQFRTRASAGFTFSMAAIGAGLGPLSVGFFSQYVFDSGKLGLAVATSVALALPIAVLSLVLALPQIRRMVQENASQGRDDSA